MWHPFIKKLPMAIIQPFKPIRPNPLYADQLVFTKPQAESVSGDYTKEGGLKSLKTLLETGARQRPETPEGQQLAYQDIKDTLQSLLEKEQLYREELPGIYIYEVVHQTYRQCGIWALTDLSDYTNGHIKIHELTFEDSVRRLKNYRENTGLEGSPILLTYAPCMTINRIIASIKETQRKATLGKQHGLHRIWKIGEADTQQALIEAFKNIGQIYLADGHHRLASAALSGFTTISSLYMACDHLRIEPYNRIVIPDSPVVKAKLFEQLSQRYHVMESKGNQPVQPKEPKRLGLCLEGQWYHLLYKTIAESLDAEILQEHILSKIFAIEDPKTDDRLKCAGGEKALEEIGAIFDAHPQAIAFTLCPLTVNELIHAADAGQILPPKSTWIVPKVPYGLLINSHLL
ncbi:MAG: hypothetical protein JWQ66_4452 [Mucilaginibacter sp.]|nr:hypothetical protein [Mucilaginibacter sp.]